MKLIVIALLIMIAGCTSKECDCTSPSPTPEPSPVASATPTLPSPLPESYLSKAKLSWEVKPERADWTRYLISQVSDRYDSLVKAKDWGKMCIKFSTLPKEKQIHAMSEFFVWVAYHESGWSPISRMIETTMGKDPITGSQVASEGLFQLSYQDIKWAPWCKFDWAKDKGLAVKDPAKTILDPYKNIECGVGIMARQVDRKGALLLESSVYWSVLRIGGKYSKIDSIASKVNALSFCK